MNDKSHEWFLDEIGPVAHDILSSANPQEAALKYPNYIVESFILGHFMTIYNNSGIEGYLYGPAGCDLEECIELAKKVPLINIAEGLKVIKDTLGDKILSQHISIRRRIVNEFKNKNNIQNLDDYFNLRLDSNFWSKLKDWIFLQKNSNSA